MLAPASVFNRNNFILNKVVISGLVLYHNIAKTTQISQSDAKLSSNPKWEEPEGYDTKISIYNHFLKRKTKLILLNKNILKWYSCGPTVYDSAHIGHASSYVKLDIIRRILINIFDINVCYLMGITDIDDKIIKRSIEAKEDFRSLAQKYEVEFLKDLEKLNIIPPSLTVKVSDNIPEIISFVERIVENGHGYKSPSGSVYFAAHQFAAYGKLVPAQLSEGSSPEKRSSLDFTLWKAAKAGEPSWPSPWGPGRPGWHIECSAMASKVLGPRLDLHSGGMDLVFPHHENEEAQSCAFHNTTQWVNYWLHTGHLQLKGDVKMSKSLKNTISISTLLESYTSNHFRMLCLLSPYRNRIEFSDETMSVAVGNCRRIESFVDDCALYLSGARANGEVDESAVLASLEQTKALVLTHLADDFDTARAFGEILHFVSMVNAMICKPMTEPGPRSYVAISAASDFVKDTLGKLGFGFISRDSGERSCQLGEVVEAALAMRATTRQTALSPGLKPMKAECKALLQACDTLRDSLHTAGIEIKDHGSAKSTWSLKDVVASKSDSKD